MSNTYYKELTDSENMETAQLTNGGVVVEDQQNGMVVQQNGGVENVCCNEVHQNGDCCGGEKPISTEMSTSTTSLKCCSGLWNQRRKFKIVKETQTQQVNGGSVTVPLVQQTHNGGTNFYDTLKQKFAQQQNGKHCGMNGGGKVKCEKAKKATIIIDNRDPCHVNSGLSYEYSNIFAEPNNGTFSWTPIWSFSNNMYFNVKLYLYRIFSILIGIPLVFIWSVFFSLFSVFQIWILAPILRLFKALCAILRDIWWTIIDTVLGPIFQLFQYIRVPQHQWGGVNVANVV